MKVIWSNTAINSLQEQYEYIKLSSPSADEKVKNEIIRAAEELRMFPNKYQFDEYYPNEEKNVRRFFRWRYRIVYQVDNDLIVILNVIHASQEPNKRIT